jgi:pyruvate/2-oxoglutarate/acetoin dehydrogenase E1 component
LRVLAPATVADARGMLATALRERDPVIIFEHTQLYGLEEELAAPAPVDLDRAAIRRPGTDATIITYGGSLPRALAAAEALAAEHVAAEVIDLRTLRPLDTEALVASVARTHRAVIVDEGWRTGSLAGEIAAILGERAFWDLDAPVGRVCSAEVPMPYARHLELAALPSVEAIVAAVKAVMHA